MVIGACLVLIYHQFGESVALYFAFLSSYTQSLVYIAALGIGFFLLRLPYSAVYSTLLVLWSVTFVEYWRILERKLSVRWGCRGSVRVERRRAQYRANDVQGARFPWWKRDMRIFASLPVVLFFAGILAAILTGIFLFEAFVTALYTGPGHMIIVRRCDSNLLASVWLTCFTGIQPDSSLPGLRAAAAWSLSQVRSAAHRMGEPLAPVNL